MGATVIALGAAEVPQVSADEIEGATASESVAGSESGTVSEALDASENAAQPILQESENSTNSVTLSAVSKFNEPKKINEISEEIAAVDEVDYATILSTTAVDCSAVISLATDAINTAPWGIKDYQTVGSSADYAGKTVEVTKEQVTDYGVTWALVSLDGKELGWIAKESLNEREDVVEVRQETITEDIPYTTIIEIDSKKVNTYEAIKQESLDTRELVYDSTIQDEADLRTSEECSSLDFYAPNLGIDHIRPDGSPYYSLLDPEKSSAENLLLNTISASADTYSVNEKELATLICNQCKSSNGHYANMIDPQLNANAVSIQLVDKDGWLVYVASELLINNL